jgi:hypothetical protein
VILRALPNRSTCMPQPPVAHNAPSDVRFGSEADMCSATPDVRFTPNSDRKSRHAANGHVRFASESGHVRCIHPCLLRARSGHAPMVKSACALLCFLRRASSPIRLRPLCPLLENGPLKNHSLIDDPGIPAPGVIRIEIHQIETVPTEDPNEIGRRRSHY